MYVDGFNLYYGAMKGQGPGYKWLDLSALCRRLLPENDIRRIRYFSARLTARPDDLRLPERQAAYLRAVGTLPEVSTHLGQFKVSYPRMPLYDKGLKPGEKPQTVKVIKTEEKGSDVNLATYLILDACRADCEVAVVITNDSDLAEPIRLARDELGITVGVVNPHQTTKRSREIEATFFRQLRSNVVAACQFPDELVDAEGRTIHKPKTW